MDTKAAAVAPAPDMGMVQVQSVPAAAPATAEPAVETPAATPNQVEMRLVIEMDQASGSYVYKTVNRLTGEVVLQLPRDQVLHLKELAGYEAGAVIRTKA
jgi:flagellar protein FlaG